MSKLIRLWLLLASTFGIAAAVLAVLVYREIDLGPEVAIRFAAIPLLQATALAWLAGALALAPLRSALLQAASHRWVVALVALGVLAIGVRMTLLRGATGTYLMAGLAGAEAMTAALLLAAAGCRPRWLPDSLSIRKTLPLAAVLMVVGSNGFRPWLAAAPGALPVAWPPLLRLLLVFGGLALLLVSLLLRFQTLLRRDHAGAAVLVGGCHAAAIGIVLIAILSRFLHPSLQSPWVDITVALLLLGATCVLSAVLLVLSPTVAGVLDTTNEGSGNA